MMKLVRAIPGFAVILVQLALFQEICRGLDAHAIESVFSRSLIRYR